MYFFPTVLEAPEIRVLVSSEDSEVEYVSGLSLGFCSQQSLVFFLCLFVFTCPSPYKDKSHVGLEVHSVLV